MINPKVVAVEPEGSQFLVLAFANGERRRFDVSPYFDKGIFRELRNPVYFRCVRAVSGYVTWPHDQDFSWDTLYLEGVPVDDPIETPTDPSACSTPWKTVHDALQTLGCYPKSRREGEPPSRTRPID